MNQSPSLPDETNWIPLKEAARLLGCSVKTIRRRIKGGTWRSMIEYRGQKAIRLVAREDVAKETVSLDRLPVESPERTLALQALDGLPRELGEVVQSYLSGLKKELDRKTLHSRIYLLITLGITAIILTGAGFYFGYRREEVLNGRIEAMSRTLSTTLTRGQANLGKEISRISSLATESRRLAEGSREDLERQYRRLETILGSIDKLEGGNRLTRRETEKAREELADLRRELGRLEDLLLRSKVPGNDYPEGQLSQEEKFPTPTPAAPPESEPAPEKSTSRFLGIF